MNLSRVPVVALLALGLGLASLPLQAQPEQSNVSGDPLYSVEAPPAFAMLGDLLIARPLLIAATVVGTGAFVVSLPFTAASGGIGSAGNALVVEPAKAAFVRCLGCTGSGYDSHP